MRAHHRFLLAHHGYYEYDRCVRLMLGTEVIFVCARCVGIYIGAACTMLVLLCVPTASTAFSPWLIALLPAPAFVDWAAHVVTASSGSNVRRIGSGVLLGVSYAWCGLAIAADRRVGLASAIAVVWVLVFVSIKRLAAARHDNLSENRKATAASAVYRAGQRS